MDTLGKRIRKLRQYHNLTQAQLAEGICTCSAISQIEADRIHPSTNTLSLLAQRLKCPFEQLLYGDDLNTFESDYESAKELMKQSYFFQAARIIDSLIDLPFFDTVKNKKKILFDLGVCHLELGMFDRAIPIFRGLIGKENSYSPENMDIPYLVDCHRAIARAYEEELLLNMVNQEFKEQETHKETRRFRVLEGGRR